jgi:hypothetical protein
LVENHLLYVIFHRQVPKRTNPPSGNDPLGSFLPLTNVTNHHNDETR